MTNFGRDRDPTIAADDVAMESNLQAFGVADSESFVLKLLVILSILCFQSFAAEAGVMDWLFAKPNPPPSTLDPSALLRSVLVRSGTDRLTPQLDQYFTDLTATLNLKERANFLSRFETTIFTEDDTAFMGALLYTKNKAILQFRKSLIGHSYFEMVFVHEISHLGRIDLVRSGLISPYTDEALAFSDQYDYGRRRFSEETALQLQTTKVARLNMSEVKLLISAGVLGPNGERLRLASVQKKNLVELKLVAAYNRYVAADYDVKLANDLKSIWTMSREEYVRYRLTSSSAYTELRKNRSDICREALGAGF